MRAHSSTARSPEGTQVKLIVLEMSPPMAAVATKGTKALR